MSQIEIKVTADAESIQAYCHNVEGMLKTIYNDQLRKVKAINILKRIEKVVNIIGLLLATCCVVDFFVKFIPKFFLDAYLVMDVFFIIIIVMCILAGLIYSKSSNINPALLEKGKKATYKEFIEQAISPLNDKGGLYIEEYLAVKKPKVLSADIHTSTDPVTGNKSKALNVVYVDNNTVTSKIDSRSIVFSVIRSAIIPIDILTDYEKISEPELYYESGFNLLLPDSHLEDYYKVDIDDFVSVTKNFDIISREIDN